MLMYIVFQKRNDILKNIGRMAFFKMNFSQRSYVVASLSLTYRQWQLLFSSCHFFGFLHALRAQVMKKLCQSLIVKFMSIWYEYGMFICTSYICCVDDEIDNGYIYYFIQFVKEQDSQV